MIDLSNCQLFFFDFDGVVKNSTQLKEEAFVELFPTASPEVRSRILAHHSAHQGESRFLKLPKYITWAGGDIESLNTYAEAFRNCIVEKVIAAEWVPGVQSFLERAAQHGQVVIVSATPQEELWEIVERLNLGPILTEVFGYPAQKAIVVRDVLNQGGYLARDAVYFGDSRTDIEAAATSKVRFILCANESNTALCAEHPGPIIQTFNDLLLA